MTILHEAVPAAQRLIQGAERIGAGDQVHEQVEIPCARRRVVAIRRSGTVAVSHSVPDGQGTAQIGDPSPRSVVEGFSIDIRHEILSNLVCYGCKNRGMDLAKQTE